MRRSYWPLIVAVLLPSLALAQEQAGALRGEIGDAVVGLPLVRSDYDIDIQGALARVRVTQAFENPHNAPMRAQYLFPLNQMAAVHAMQMRIGEEVVTARIAEKRKAEERFETAASEGRTASLLTQARPNMFTQDIANLMPGVSVEVTLSYVQQVPRIDGAHELVVPLLVGPRYAPAPPDAEAQAGEMADDSGWKMQPLPAYPPVHGVTLPDSIAVDRVGLALRLTSAVPVAAFSSPSHDLNVQADGTSLRAEFAAGRVIDNRDLVVRYQPGGAAVTAGVLTHRDESGQYLALTIEPPQGRPQANTAREVVFVLDTSGSMGGAPLVASKRFMQAALAGLGPQDQFRILSFSDQTRQFSDRALPATEANRQAGLVHVRGLRANGGTEMDRALRDAFANPPQGEALRIVVFLTDGYIGNEAQVLRRIRRNIGEARIYAFGVGNSVNRYLLDAMAREGRGRARYVNPDENAGEVAAELARDLEAPILTDLVMDWGDLRVTEMTPEILPDLFAGRPVQVLARYEGSGDIRLTGRMGGQAGSLPVQVPEAEASPDGVVIPLIWARSRIADHTRALAVGDGRAASHEAEILRLGLAHGLQSRFTSFVAVSERIANPGGGQTASAVALPQGAQVPVTAYSGISGASTPAPTMWLSMMVLAGLVSLRLHRGRRDC